VRTLHGSALDEALYNGLLRLSVKRFLMHLYFYACDLIAVLRATRVVAVSGQTRRHHPRVSAVIPNGIDLSLFRPMPESKSTFPSILFVGQMKTRKRGDLLLKAFLEKVRPQWPSAELWLVCPERVRAEGCRWFGPVRQETLIRLYQQAWIFCLPSSYEGFGRPYLEAMAAGTPVVTTENTGASELLEAGRCGLLVAPAKLGDALHRLLLHGELRADYIRKGLERAQAYGWNRVAGQYEQLYESIASSRKAPGANRRILYLQSTSEISGTDIALLRTIEALDPSRFEPHVVLHRLEPFSEEYRRAGAHVHEIPSMRQLSAHRGLGYLLRYLVGYPAAVVRIARLIRRERIDLVHTNTLHNLYGFLAARLTARPHVWHVREIVVQSPLLRWLERGLVTRFSSRILVMDNAIARMFLKPGGGMPAHIVKLYDGVDLEQLQPAVSGLRIRRELGLDETTPLVGMVARLDPAKGSDLFLEAAARVHAQEPRCRFLLCGGEIQGHEGYEATLRERAESLGIGRVTLFTGWRYRLRDIPEVYGALDILLQCPAYPEPYGLTCVEAMASGVPVVTFREGGPAELCADGETALLVPAGDTTAAAGAVISLLRNPEKRRALGEAGRRRAERLFDRRRCVRELEALYDAL